MLPSKRQLPAEVCRDGPDTREATLISDRWRRTSEVEVAMLRFKELASACDCSLLTACAPSWVGHPVGCDLPMAVPGCAVVARNRRKPPRTKLNSENLLDLINSDGIQYLKLRWRRRKERKENEISASKSRSESKSKRTQWSHLCSKTSVAMSIRRRSD